MGESIRTQISLNKNLFSKIDLFLQYPNIISKFQKSKKYLILIKTLKL